MLTGTQSCLFFNTFHPMIWQEFKTEWGYFSWELSPLSQLTGLGPAGRAHKYAALNVLPSVFVTLVHN